MKWLANCGIILEVIVWNIKWKKITNSFFYNICRYDLSYKLHIMIHIGNAPATMSPGLGLAHLLNPNRDSQRFYDLPNSGKAKIRIQAFWLDSCALSTLPYSTPCVCVFFFPNYSDSKHFFFQSYDFHYFCCWFNLWVNRFFPNTLIEHIPGLA